MSDPMGFFSDDFTGIEASEGLVGGDLVPEQWALLHIEQAELRKAGTGTLMVNMRLRCDEKLALTPKRSFFWSLPISDKMEPQIVGFTKATGLGRTQKRFGDPAGKNDARPQFAASEMEMAVTTLAKALVGKNLIGHVSIEAGDKPRKDSSGKMVAPTTKYPDRNRVQAFFTVTEANLQALVGGGFSSATIGTKEVAGVGGTKERTLVAKAAKAEGAKPVAAGSPSVIN